VQSTSRQSGSDGPVPMPCACKRTAAELREEVAQRVRPAAPPTLANHTQAFALHEHPLRQRVPRIGA
jgi:hypothetical protein